jgi:hypothetical protein
MYLTIYLLFVYNLYSVMSPRRWLLYQTLFNPFFSLGYLIGNKSVFFVHIPHAASTVKIIYKADFL